MFADQITIQIEHLFDRTHKRVAAVKLERFRDLVIHYEHQRDVEARAAGRCLAEAYRKGWFELPLFNHEIKQLIGRVNLVADALPQLEFPPFDDAAITECLARSFSGFTLVKEAQATSLKEAFDAHLAKEQMTWLDELAPLTIPWPDGRKLKLQYTQEVTSERRDVHPPELQVKLHECFGLKEHPTVCEGKVPVKLWLCAPEGKRLEPTLDWPKFKSASYPKLRPTLQKKYPGFTWP
jgi:ATP-dependent helicase HrpB